MPIMPCSPYFCPPAAYGAYPMYPPPVLYPSLPTAYPYPPFYPPPPFYPQPPNVHDGYPAFIQGLFAQNGMGIPPANPNFIQHRHPAQMQNGNTSENNGSNFPAPEIPSHQKVNPWIALTSILFAVTLGIIALKHVMPANKMASVTVPLRTRIANFLHPKPQSLNCENGSCHHEHHRENSDTPLQEPPAYQAHESHHDR